MALIKCPRCELNYIQEEEGYCKICRREMKGEQPRDEIEMCTVCNEAPALPGKDMCLFCLKELGEHPEDADADTEEPVDESALGIDPVSTMEEIIPDIGNDDMNGQPYAEGDLSLEEMEEDEDEDDDEDEDE